MAKITYHDSTAKGVVHIVKCEGRTLGKIEKDNTNRFFYRANAGCRSPLFKDIDALKRSLEAD